jgi:GNAT superfamily N-acetyltransferase
MSPSPLLRLDPYPLVDLSLARQLERAEANANAAFVESRARLEPEIGCEWIEVAGAYAMFDGAGSPLTQSFGLGLFGPTSPPGFDLLEGFFTQRGAEVFHEVSPLAEPGTLEALPDRGYRPVEYSSVLYRPTGAGPGIPRSDLAVRRIETGEADRWSALAAEGWRSESDEIGEFVQGFGRISARARGAHCFVAESDGIPIATGALAIHDGVALLAGASTIPEGRRRGAQQALLASRIEFARANGCSIAMVVAQPGSASQRNAERNGFRIAYTRIKWHLAVTM